MGDWYIVIKTIKGHKYRYRQRTWREGKRVRTQSFSLGPVREGEEEAPPAQAAPAPPTGLQKRVHETVSFLADPANARGSWIPAFDRQLGSKTRIKRIKAIDAVVKGCRPNLVHSGDRAFYRVMLDRITMPFTTHFVEKEIETAQMAYYTTLMHELAHWTGHASRTARFARSDTLKAEKNRAAEELVAEATAVVVLQELGYPPPNMGRHGHYFQSWLRDEKDKDAVLAYVRREAELAAGFILGRPVSIPGLAPAAPVVESKL